MRKFSPGEKLQVVLEYLNDKESYKEIGPLLGQDYKSIVKWVKQYEYNGVLS